MQGSIESPEQPTNIIPIRQAYFSPQFWKEWDQLMDRQKAAYILGWISELELVIRRMSEHVQIINEHLEEDK